MAHIAEMCEWRKETLVSNIHHAIRIVFGALILPIYGSIPKLLRRHRKASKKAYGGAWLTEQFYVARREFY